MTVNPIPVPAAAPERAARTTRRGRLAMASLALVLSAGVVLAQVLQQPKAAPAAAAAPADPVRPPPPPRLETVSAQRGEIWQTVDAAGKLQLYKYADVHAQVAGQIKDVLVAVGDSVHAGEALIDITPTLQPAQMESNRAQMARLQAELADQRAQLDFAELQFKRQTQLKAQNATREDAFESSRMSVSSASARMDAINAQIRQLEATLKSDEERRQQTQVLAPLAGTVVALNARPGQKAGAEQGGAALLRIADLSKMTVQARVAEVDVTRLRRGMTANFKTPGYPGRIWSGKLRQVIPVPADGTGEQGKQTFYNVLFDVNNPEQELMSGMSTQVQFIVAQAHDALLLPAALLGKPDADGLYSVNVLDAQRQPGARKLKIGLRNQQQVQVLSGLEEGEQVLVGAPPARPKAPAAAAPAVSAQALNAGAGPAERPAPAR